MRQYSFDTGFAGMYTAVKWAHCQVTLQVSITRPHKYVLKLTDRLILPSDICYMTKLEYRTPSAQQHLLHPFRKRTLYKSSLHGHLCYYGKRQISPATRCIQRMIQWPLWLTFMANDNSRFVKAMWLTSAYKNNTHRVPGQKRHTTTSNSLS